MWVLAATVPIGDNAVAELTKMAERSGVTLVVIDWTAHPIPPLAALFAGTKVVVSDPSGESWRGGESLMPGGPHDTAG